MDTEFKRRRGFSRYDQYFSVLGKGDLIQQATFAKVLRWPQGRRGTWTADEIWHGARAPRGRSSPQTIHTERAIVVLFVFLLLLILNTEMTKSLEIK